MGYVTDASDVSSQRMITRARAFLTCRGRESAFYAQNLGTLLVLTEPRMSAQQLFEAFLDSRTQWMLTEPTVSDEATRDEPTSLAHQTRYLAVVVRSMNLTVRQTEELFSGANSAFPAFAAAMERTPGLQTELEEFVASGRLHTKLAEWFSDQHKTVRQSCSGGIV